MNQHFLSGLAAVLLLTACGSHAGNDAASSGGNTTAAEGGTAAAAANVPDACTFIPKAELEAAVGWELRDGEPQSVPDTSESQCEFKRQLGSRTTRTFPNPAVPGSAGLTSVTISTSPSQAAKFREGRELTGGESVAGVGDDAFFIGPSLLHVRVGGRSFSVRINPDAQSPDDQAKVRATMLALGRTGAARLRRV